MAAKGIFVAVDPVAALLVVEFCDRERLAAQGISIPYDQLSDLDVDAIRIIRTEFDSEDKRRLEEMRRKSKTKSRR